MGFAEIALPLAERGVAVVPTDPGLRFPFRKNWQNIATTDPAQIAARHEQNPNQNCCSVVRAGGVGFLDIDRLRDCEALGMPALPQRRARSLRSSC
jgi:Bifunctional DNA primase/polymerase, N-terminal